MTEQQACTLCGMEGHIPAQCIWNGNEKALAIVQEIDKRNAARSALAQPSPECVACEDSPVDGNNPCAVCGKQAQPSPAPELERPEFPPIESAETLSRYLIELIDAAEQTDSVPSWPDWTKPRADAIQNLIAQHDRIVGALRAERDAAQSGQVPEGILEALERIASIPSNSINFHPSHMSRIAREALAAAPAQGGE